MSSPAPTAAPVRAAWALRLAALRPGRNTAMAAGAIVLGVAAVVLARSAIERRVATAEQALRREQPEAAIVVARRDLAAGEEVSSESFAVRAIPLEFTHASAVRPEGFDAVARQRLASALRRGEPLLAEHLEGGGGAVFSALLRPGRRALTVEVDDRNAIAGLLRPGDRVDLLLSATPPAHAGPAEPARELTVPLLTAVAVLATGQTVRRDEAGGGERSYSTITLELSPAEAQRVVVARAAGTLTAVLRHPEDGAAVPLDPLALGDVLGPPARPRPVAVRPGPVEMLIGAPQLPETTR